jgi:K+-sensing histidine kinase KdpD
MRPSRRSLCSPENSLIGIGLCAVLAGLLSVFLRDDPVRSIVPLLFLLVLIPVAHLWGASSCIIGACIATLMFACFLFRPIGSLTVQDTADRIILTTCHFIAIAVAYLSSPRPPRRGRSLHTEMGDQAP